MKRKRGYSRNFAGGRTGKNYLLKNVPAPLWRAAESKARREGLSMRGAVLQLITIWTNGGVAIAAPDTTEGQ